MDVPRPLPEKISPPVPPTVAKESAPHDSAESTSRLNPDVIHRVIHAVVNIAQPEPVVQSGGGIPTSPSIQLIGELIPEFDTA